MSVFKQFSLLLTLAISVISCNDVSKHHNFESKYSFEKTDSLVIDLDAKTSYEFRNLHYYQNDSLEWLVVMNENINGLNIYDLNSGHLVSQFSVPKSGPHSVPTLNGFTIISPDSIFLYTRMSIKNIEIVNYRGDTLSNLRVSNQKEVSDYKHSVFNHVSNNPGPTIFYNNKLYFTKWPLFSFSMAKNISKDYSLEFVLDLSTLKIAALPVHYPKWAQNKGWHTSYLLNGKAMNNKGDFIYTIQGDDSISVHFANGEKKRFYAGLSQTGIEKKPITKKTQKAREIKDVISTTIYRRMFYDKYRNLYYRIADSPIPFTSEYRSLVPAIFEKPLSIIVMDEDFKKVGEFGLAKDTYYFPGIFIGKKGMYVPRLNTKYKDFSEDRVTYSIYHPVLNGE